MEVPNPAQPEVRVNKASQPDPPHYIHYLYYHAHVKWDCDHQRPPITSCTIAGIQILILTVLLKVCIRLLRLAISASARCG